MRLAFMGGSVLQIILLTALVHGLPLKLGRTIGCKISMCSVQTVASNLKQSTGVTFSGSSGAAVEISSVRLSIGNNDIMSDVNWTILPKERWALVGRNGAGKSTLLRAITGTGGELVSISEGGISIAKKARMGYLEQKGVSGSIMTVREEVSSRMDRLTAATAALELSEKAVSAGDTSDESLVALERASVEFEAAGGYTVEQKIANVLKGLGFIEEDYDRYCSEFSGGWQMRIALARLLLSEPDLLLLDEPTNHLDKGAREWLGDYLSNYDGTLLVVSHDTNLLQVAVSSIAEVRSGSVELYKSRSHDQWVVERDDRVKQAQALYDANQKEIARLQTFVDRFGTKTMGASMAQSRLKTIEKLETSGIEAPKIGDGPMPVLKLPTPPRGSLQLLELKGCTLAWPAKAVPEGEGEVDAAECAAPPSILTNCNLIIRRGMRVVVRGPNGAAREIMFITSTHSGAVILQPHIPAKYNVAPSKSTLLSALSGRLTPLAGTRTEGDGLELGVFTQDLAQDLDQDSIATDVVTQKVRQKDPTISDETARKALGALGLTGEKSVRKVGHLSGGEKARVALASFVLIPHNLLLLDEPSNHLDVTTLKVLTAALRKFEGSVVVISHDRQFLEELEPTHVVTVRGGVVDCQERGLREEDWNDPIDSREEGTQKYATTTSAANARIAAMHSASVTASASAVPSSVKKSVKSTATSASSLIAKAASDFGSGMSSTQKINSNSKGKGKAVEVPAVDASLEMKKTDDELRKTILNAPRRISKIESSIAKHEVEIKKIDEEMIVEGRNRGKLYDLQKSKDEIQVKVDKLYAEYEYLLELIE